MQQTAPSPAAASAAISPTPATNVDKYRAALLKLGVALAQCEWAAVTVLSLQVDHAGEPHLHVAAEGVARLGLDAGGTARIEDVYGEPWEFRALDRDGVRWTWCRRLTADDERIVEAAADSAHPLHAQAIDVLMDGDWQLPAVGAGRENL
jgi:hypothetical protein